MSEKYTKDKEKRINLMISLELVKKFKIHCINNDFNFSKRIRELIEKDINGEIK